MNAAPQTLPENYELHWYTIRRVLGQGGFGVTYLARDSNLERDVAIKEYMPRDLAMRKSDYTICPLDDSTTENLKWGLDRFILEARTLSKFNHPNIVRVHSVFEENNTAYMVMSYERGRSFHEVLKEGQPSEEELLDIIMPLLDGLEEMHKEGFIHRDIKPGNIFIREDGTALLLDFGSARQAMGEETKTLTRFVTPGYAPFEQYYGRSDVQGPWTDIYSLGATLYRAITGDPPVDSTFRNRLTGEQAIQEIWEILDKHGDNYSTFFLRAIEHSLRSNHKERPQSVEEWRKMLSDPKLSTQTQWRMASSKGSGRKGMQDSPGMRKRRRILLYTLLLVAVAAGVLVLAYFR